MIKEKIWVSLSVCVLFAVYIIPVSGQQSPSPENAPALDEAGLLVERPDTAKIMAELSIPLKLSTKQENRIKTGLKSIEARFDKIDIEQKEAMVEARKWKFKLNDIRYEMNKLKKIIPDIIREQLDPEQRGKFDQMQDEKQSAKKPEMLPDSAAAQPLPSAAGQGQPSAQEDLSAGVSGQEEVLPSAQPQAKKKVRKIRRRKKAQAVQPAAEERPANPGSEPSGNLPPLPESGETGDSSPLQ